MPLTVRFDVNNDSIGHLTITRQFADADYLEGAEEARYDYVYSGAKGWNAGSILHRPSDGAMTLAAKVMEQIDFPNWKLV